MYSNIKVYQTYLVTSIKVGCATRSLYASSGPKAERVPTNNQRGWGSGPCRLWGDLDKARHIVPTALLVRVQRFRNDLYKAVKGPSTRPIVPLDDRWVILTTSKAFHYFRARRDEIRFAFDPTKFVNKITVEDRVSDSLWNIILKRYFTKFGQKFRVWPKEFPKRFPKLVISVTLCQKFWSDLKIFRMEIKNASTTSSKSN